MNLRTLAAACVITTIGYTSTALRSATGQPTNSYEQSRLMQGCEKGNLEQVQAALTAGADVNLVCNNNDEDTALTLAVKSNCAPIVKELLCARSSKTALYWALERRNDLVTRILVERGAHLPIEHQGELYFRITMFPVTLSAVAKKFLQDYESLQQNSLPKDLIHLIWDIADLSPPHKLHPYLPPSLDLGDKFPVSAQIASKLLPTGS